MKLTVGQLRQVIREEVARARGQQRRPIREAFESMVGRSGEISTASKSDTLYFEELLSEAQDGDPLVLSRTGTSGHVVVYVPAATSVKVLTFDTRDPEDDGLEELVDFPQGVEMLAQHVNSGWRVTDDDSALYAEVLSDPRVHYMLGY